MHQVGIRVVPSMLKHTGQQLFKQLSANVSPAPTAARLHVAGQVSAPYSLTCSQIAGRVVNSTGLSLFPPIAKEIASSTLAAGVQHESKTSLNNQAWRLYNSRCFSITQSKKRVFDAATKFPAPAYAVKRTGYALTLANAQTIAKTGCRSFASQGSGAAGSVSNAKEPGKFKQMFKKYGLVFVVTYAAIYLTTLSTLFLLVDSKLMKSQGFGDDEMPDNPLNPMEVQAKVFKWLNEHGFDMAAYQKHAEEKVVGFLNWLGVETSDKNNTKVSSFVIAWITAKFTEPLRAVVAIMITPWVARAIGRVPK